MCLKATRGGNNLFGKYGPNAWVSVWVLFCSEVGLHVDLNFGLIPGPNLAYNIGLRGVDFGLSLA